MALRKKKLDTDVDSEERPSTLDRLSSLRRDITGQSAVTDLLEILIDDFGGDSEALVKEIEEGRVEVEAPEAIGDDSTVTAVDIVPVDI